MEFFYQIYLRCFCKYLLRPSPVSGESPHKGQWRGALMFSLICASINGWVNNADACNLTRHRAHYDGTVRINWESLGFYSKISSNSWGCQRSECCNNITNEYIIKRNVHLYGVYLNAKWLINISSIGSPHQVLHAHSCHVLLLLLEQNIWWQHVTDECYVMNITHKS